MLKKTRILKLKTLQPKSLIILSLFIGFLFSFISGNSQEAYYSQFYNSPAYYNPATIGLHKGLKVRINYRDQWPQYNDDLKTYNFSMDVAERFMPGSGGFGIIFNTNKEGSGFIKRNMVGVLGSVRIRLNRYWVSQVGFSGTWVQKQIDAKNFIWSDQIDNRHGLLYPYSSFSGLTSESLSYPDLNLGGVLHYEKRLITATLGLAVHHIFKPNESFFNLDIRVPRKYVFHGSMVILQQTNPRKGFKFNPGLLFENQNGFNTFTMGMNVKRSILYAGLWYRNKQSQIYNYQSAIIMAGVEIPMVDENSRLKLMYSYDLGLTGLKGTGGAHEISLKFEFDLIHLIKSDSYFANDFPVVNKPLRF